MASFSSSDVPASPGTYECRETQGAGRGLFATRAIPRGTLIHAAHTIVVPREQYEDHCRHTVFEEYLFNLPNGDRALALGDGSLFNHSATPNVDYRHKPESKIINYFAARDIDAGTELCIFYGADEDLWFVPATKTSREDEAASETDSDSASEAWLGQVGSCADPTDGETGLD